MAGSDFEQLCALVFIAFILIVMVFFVVWSVYEFFGILFMV